MITTHLTSREAADRLRLSTRTLENWRVAGKGPRFAKFGRRVVYPIAEIEAYEQRQLRRNTYERGEPDVDGGSDFQR